MSSPIIKTLYISDNTFVNDDIRFILNPALIDPRLIPEYQVSQSMVEGTEFEFDIKTDLKRTAKVYTDTIFAPVTSSQNYQVMVTTAVANRIVFEQRYDKRFTELDVVESEFTDDAEAFAE